MIKQYQLSRRQNNFEITLYYKGVKVKVNFSGGNTYKGVSPKCFESDPFKQRAIEASQLFKDREIVLLRTIAEPGDSKPAISVQTKKVSAAPKSVVKKIVKPAVQKPDTPAPVDPAPSPSDPVNPSDPSDVTEPASKEFGNLGEAILFIAQNYQTQVKTEKEARDILKANGINPVIHKG